jgi:hypothetical protein
MKTNQSLTRKMDDFKVNQRMVDGMFNATELFKQWNDSLKNKDSNFQTENSWYVKKTKDLNNFFYNAFVF